MIEVKQLVKDYGGHLAVDHLSFTVEDGQICGFLGPNGAGKSTAMNIMTGYLGATEGDVLINGRSILEEPQAARRMIGYLPELPPLYDDMTVREYLMFAASLKRLSRHTRPQAVQNAMETVGLTGVRGRLIRNLSKGYRQRVGMAQAILGEPDVIILDEPTVGLDPKQIIEIRDMIRGLAKGHTVLLSSHILSEVSAVCDRILIIAHGRLVASDTPQNLEQQLRRGGLLLLEIKGEAHEVSAVLETFPELVCQSFSSENAICRIALQAEEGTTIPLRERLFFAFAQRRLPILSMTVSHASLEDVFLELTEHNETEVSAK